MNLENVESLLKRVAELEQMVADFKAAAGFDVGSDPEGVTPAKLERHIQTLYLDLENASRTAALRVGGDPAVRQCLLDEFGTTEPELIRESAQDIRQLLAENRTFTERLLAAIRKHMNMRGDDRCHIDDHDLYLTLPEGDTRPARETAVTIENCQRYIQCRQQGRDYISPERRIQELEQLVADFKSAAGIDVGSDPAGVTPAILERHIQKLFDDLENAQQAAANLVGADPRVRDWLLMEFGTTDPDLLAGLISRDDRRTYWIPPIYRQHLADDGQTAFPTIEESEVAILRRLVNSLAERCAGQSERLTYLAMKAEVRLIEEVQAGAVAEVARMVEECRF